MRALNPEQNPDTHTNEHEDPLDIDDEHTESFESGALQSLGDSTAWTLIHHVCQSRDPVARNTCVSIAVLIPAGVGEENGQIRIAFESNDTLHIYAHWPVGLKDPLLLHKMWLTGIGARAIQQYHPQLEAYKASIEVIATKVDGRRKAVARIRLPCLLIQRVVEKHYLGWHYSA